MSGVENLLLEFVLVMIAALAVLFVFYWLKQPSVIAYIIAGVAIGPFGLSVVSNPDLIAAMGELGVLILLFFIGAEISITSLVKNWKLIIFGTLLQIAGSVGFISIIGFFFDWSWPRIILLGFVTSLSSTAVILQFLESKKIIGTKVGRDVIGVLLAQDLLIVPMLIILTSIGGNFELPTLILQLVGATVIGLAVYVVIKRNLQIPHVFSRVTHDKDYKLLVALTFCFGAALITGLFHLSLGMGAFVGGLLAANMNNFAWVRGELQAFKTLFIALFFVSIGLLIDISFFIENFLFVVIILLSALILNTIINTVVLHTLNRTWRYSLYAGAVLAPLGEFSFLLATTGLQVGAIGSFGYQLAIAVIALSLLLSPFWTRVFKRFESNAIKPT